MQERVHHSLGVVPERDHRIGAGGAEGGNVTGEQRDEREGEGDNNEGRKVDPAHIVKRRAQNRGAKKRKTSAR